VISIRENKDMGSWQYAYIFPGVGQTLAPECAVDVILASGLIFDDRVFPSVVLDDEGHLGESDEVGLKRGADEIRGRLGKGEQFLVGFRNQEIFFACVFACRYSNPHIVFGWPKKSFYELPAASQNKYWGMLRNLAKACKATFVIIINDPADFFEDRFLDVDGQRYLEKQLPDGSTDSIVSLWIDGDSMDPWPVGIREDIPPKPADGFFEYMV
jgi:hypothetical protein